MPRRPTHSHKASPISQDQSTQEFHRVFETDMSAYLGPGNDSISGIVADLTDPSLQWLRCPETPFVPGFPFDIFNDIQGSMISLDSFASQAAVPQRTMLPFLKRFTESSGITDGFDCGTLAQRRQLYNSIDDSHCQFLKGKTREIATMIRRTMTRTQPCSNIGLEWSPVMEKGCFEFFSPVNLQRFLLLFWSGWYPNTPIIHRPTFNPESEPPGLVASLAVLGACMSPEPGDCVRAMAWLAAVEEAVFSDALLFDDSVVASSDLVGDEQVVWDRMKALQAAYFVCIAQNWEGSKDGKQRIRKQRYSHIVSIARSFGLYNLSLGSLDATSPTNQKWIKFILIESMIRTATYIYLLDSAFVLFWRLPSRVMSLELNTGLVCPEACFQAGSAAECFLHLYTATKARQNQFRLRVSSCVRLLCSSQHVDLDLFRNLSSFNMFTIISALCCLVFQYQTTLVDVSQMSPAATGLSRWLWLWRHGDNIKSSSEDFPSDGIWERIGFMQHADEYYHLACAMLERWKHDESQIRANLAAWATPFGQVQGTPKYDDGEMVQVKALIHEMENMAY
ncbi:hypothetical protein FMUND_12403 [Fusarium mundagurra]|uniref:Xylanolytic transcriptional activator regulatory domain-containing protein n=1 Tax=Fusarium mundagurra TaxID=1567541 RepID=A0A8H5Y2J2_9HYPO|nr:hypothetical protein FMUND_12403 [Fusarium mundagurra]